MIDIRDVHIVKAGKQLFQHFSWQIRGGENWVITGRNGSGKTTLLEIIAGSLHAQHGEVVYDFVKGGTWEERYWDRKRKIKLIPANAIHTLFQGNRELYYQQRYYASDANIRTVRELLGDGLYQIKQLDIPASLSIDVLLDRDITRLSNGQLKKVLLLQHLTPEVPTVLLLDYPFEGLDRESRQDLSAFIDFISIEYGVQIILIDHHHHVPSVMNRKLTLDDFAIADESAIVANAGFVNITNDKHFISSEPTAQPVVDIRNLRIQYGDTVILDNFNWTIYPGERWALVGKNGSGKTTLFSLIFADHPMGYSQEIYLFGKRRGTGESIWDIKKRINYLGPELVSYLNPKTIYHSPRTYLLGLHKNPDTVKLQELICYFQTEAWFDQPVYTLSSGQLQLMLIISAFLEDKELLLLDEPFQFLDPSYKKRVSEYLQTHVSPQTTLILITHYEEDMLHWTEKTMAL